MAEVKVENWAAKMDCSMAATKVEQQELKWGCLKAVCLAVLTVVCWDSCLVEKTASSMVAQLEILRVVMWAELWDLRKVACLAYSRAGGWDCLRVAWMGGPKAVPKDAYLAAQMVEMKAGVMDGPMVVPTAGSWVDLMAAPLVALKAERWGWSLVAVKDLHLAALSD